MTPSGIPNMMSAIVLSLVAQHLARRNPVAVLIPEDISATAVPPGERKFHSFLKILFDSRPDVIRKGLSKRQMFKESHCPLPK